MYKIFTKKSLIVFISNNKNIFLLKLGKIRRLRSFIRSLIQNLKFKCKICNFSYDMSEEMSSNNNNNSIILFDSVFRGFINSFSPIVDQNFAQFELVISSGEKSSHHLNALLETTLISFPRSHHLYSNIIETLTKFVRSNPPAIVTWLCSKFKYEVNRSQNIPPTIITISSLSFDMTNSYHYHFLRYLTLIFLSDLIYTIYREFPNRQVSKLVPCGYNLCSTAHSFSKLQNLLIETWSLIFYHFSTNSLEDITRAFDQYIDDSNSGRIFHLISRVQGNQQLADSLLYALQHAKKRKALNSEMLSHLAVLLSRLDCDEEVLNEFFKLAWEIKGQQQLKYGAIDLITSLFNRIPSQTKKQQQFYSTRVYKHVHDDRKIERSLHAFLRLIRGDISRIIDAGEGTDPLAFIDSKSDSGSESYLSIFMRTFYAKSNFGVCPELFRDVLVHLASLDISEFKNVLPKFLNCDSKDPKFLVILMTIPLINREEFETKSYCRAKKKQIAEVNKLVRESIRKRMALFEKLLKNKANVYIQDFFQIQAQLDEADHEVEEYIARNGYEQFDCRIETSKSKLVPGNSRSVNLHMLKCIPMCFTKKDFMEENLIRLILQLTVNKNQLISATAVSVYTQILLNEKVEFFVLSVLIKYIKQVPIRELRIRLIQLLFQTIMKLNATISDEMYSDLESTAIFVFMSDLPRCRALSMRMLKYLGAIGKSQAYTLLNENSDRISANINRTMLVLNIPPKPSVVNPPMGRLNYDLVCCSRYYDIWLIFYSEIINLLIDNHMVMKQLGEITSRFIHNIPLLIETKTITENVASALYLIYFNSLTVDVNFDFLFREEEEEEEEEEGGSSNRYEFPIIYEAEKLFANIIETGSYEVKRALLHTLRYLNWRIIPSVLPAAMKIDQSLYKDFSTAFSIIIQNEENFQRIIAQIFSIFLEFLSLLQDYFVRLKINNTRTIQYDYEKLKENQDVCLNYCILISAAFNNISYQLPEEQFSVSYRQILFNFLIHWAQLPDEFEKLRGYALNALIPITHAGTIFTNGFEIDLTIFDMMVQCQMSGFPVLDSLLIFHFDILINIYVKQAFLKPRRESQIFIDAILTSLEQCDSTEIFHSHVGALILLAYNCGAENIEAARIILSKLAQLFLTRSHDPQAENDSIKMVQSSTTLDYVSTLFQFATEEVIASAFEIIKESKKAIVVKTLSEYLMPWFTKIRLLPKGTYILQGVPTKFRVYTVLTFIDAMFDVTKCLNDDQLDVFADLWYVLLQSADNNVVVLLCLSELEDTTLKEKIFSELLDRDQILISKYLAKRCSFRYWYFRKTQCISSNSYHQLSLNRFDNDNYDVVLGRESNEEYEPEDNKWLLHVLTRAFIDYIDLVAPICFTLTLHYAMLFIEDARELFEALISILEIESVDEMYFWAPELSDGIMTASAVVEQMAESLRQQDQTTAIEKWTQEAIRWVVGCNDIKLAYRSLVILNGLGSTFQTEQHFESLLFEAVSYHLSCVTPDDYEDVVKFVGESFKTLNQQLNNPDIANLAFHYASAFIGCTQFENKCLEKAMPIFKTCVNDEVLKSQAVPALIDAFYPFAKTLENSKYSQEVLYEMINTVNAKELYLVAAPFLIKPLPFINLNLTYNEILAMNFTMDQVHKAFWFFHGMLKTASRPLTDSILVLSTTLLLKYGKKLNRSMLVPIYQLAIQRIAVFQSAVDFLQAVSDIDPSIASLRDESNAHSKTLSDIQNEIREISDFNAETVPFTKCKNLQQLHGMISMKNPPKIYPFSTQFEVFLGMKKEQKKFLENPPRSPQKWSSTLSLTSQIMSNKSLVIASTIQTSGMTNIKFEKLEKKPVFKKMLDLPVEEDEGNWKFVVSLCEFNELRKLDEISSRKIVNNF
ncbi:hypothetical protein TRFO_06631 [Tritrichomonas foetus]|uniref:Uncharacterized protein n=1 Tax=Tritrichomonas foetus TaxID=1144522 RepID=A0A1J4JWA5_9EUKA|nr:hypothetical protein TRFO_06631 [Tritrichomonas foetus]|eukprot:OHT03415.1 hypothetical protein TRFO_06631 [Tritrichomonas foetus]